MKQIKQTYLILLIVISLFSLAIYSTYAMFTTEINTNNIVSINTSISIDTNIDEYQIITIDSNEYKILELSINNTKEENLYYGVWYEIMSGDNYNIEAYKLDTSLSSTVDIIQTTAQKNVSIVLINNTNKKATVKIGVATSQNSSLNLYEKRTLITQEISSDNIRNQTAAEYLTFLYPEEDEDVYYDNNNLLYYGTNPKNYLILNEELWQILGVYNNQLKLVKTESIGKYNYDTEINDFENSKINTLLNELYYNNASGECYKNSETEDCKIIEVGLKEETLDYLSLQTVNNEIIMATSLENINTISIMSETSFQANVTLLSLEDYQKSLKCEEDECETSWLTKSDTLLSTQNTVDSTTNVISITNGKIKIDNMIDTISDIRPVVLLKENVSIIKGDGSQYNPYVLK